MRMKMYKRWISAKESMLSFHCVTPSVLRRLT